MSVDPNRSKVTLTDDLLLVAVLAICLGVVRSGHALVMLGALPFCAAYGAWVAPRRCLERWEGALVGLVTGPIGLVTLRFAPIPKVSPPPKPWEPTAPDEVSPPR